MFKPNSVSPTNPRPIDWRSFVFTHSQLRSIGMEAILNDNPIRVRYRLVTDLVPRLLPSSMGTEDKISLAAYLVRRGKQRAAIDLLKFVREPKNFFVLANLGTAYQLEALEPEKAREYLRQASAAWPGSWKDLNKDMASRLEQLGWDPAALAWYGEAEKYHFKLVKLRAVELARSVKPAETLDNLFDVDFKYEGARLAAKEKAKLPANALPIVQQLLIWLPDDPRLYWLLGEVYHASGRPEDLKAARQIFDDLAGFNGRYRVKEIHDHLNEVRDQLAALEKIVQAQPEPLATPRMPSSPPPEQPAVVFDPKPFVIGFGAGTLITLLVIWQLRELRRRSQRRGV